MGTRRHWSILTKWLWLIVIVTAVAASGSYFVSRTAKPVYRSSTTLLVNQSQDPSTLDYNSLLLSARLAQTYVELIKKWPVLQSAIGALGLAMSPEQLAPLVSVRIVTDTQLLQITVDNTSPAVARDLANTLAKVFIDQNRNEMLGQIDSSEKILERQLALIESDLKVTNASLDRYQLSGQVPSAEYAQAQTTLLQQQQTYIRLLSSKDQMLLAVARASDSIRIVEPALLPQQPVSPNVKQNVLLAAVLGLLIGVATAYLIEYLDNTVKTPDDIQQLGHLMPLGAISRPSRSNGTVGSLMPLVTTSSPLAEQFRILQVNIEFAQLGQPGQVLLVTSPTPGDGKTTILGNLAVAMVEAGRRVVVVDCNLRQPALHKLFDLPNTVGLTDFLIREDLEVAQMLQPTPNLWVIPSGPIPANPAHLLASTQMARFLQFLRGEVDLVLLDSPAVLGTADSALLSRRADGVILVVAAGVTRTEALLRAKEILVRGPSSLVGVVVNKTWIKSFNDGHDWIDRSQSADGRRGHNPEALPGPLSRPQRVMRFVRQGDESTSDISSTAQNR